MNPNSMLKIPKISQKNKWSKPITIDANFFKKSSLIKTNPRDLPKININEFFDYKNSNDPATIEKSIQEYLKWRIRHSNQAINRNLIENEVNFIPKHALLSNNGKNLVYTGQNDFIYMIDSQTELKINDPIKADSDIICMDVSPSFTFIAVCILNLYIVVYDISTRYPILLLEDVQAEKLKFSPNNELLAVLYKKKIIVFSLKKNGNNFQEFEFDSNVLSINFSKDSNKLLIGQNLTAKLIELSTKNIIKEFKDFIFYEAILSKTDKYILGSGENKKIALWNTETGTEILRYFKDHIHSEIRNLCFSNSDHRFAYSNGNLLFVWSTTNLSKMVKKVMHDLFIVSIDFIDGTDNVITVSQSRMISVINCLKQEIIKKSTIDFPLETNARAISQTGNYLSFIHKNDQIFSIWNIKNERNYFSSNKIPLIESSKIESSLLIFSLDEELTVMVNNHCDINENRNSHIYIWKINDLKNIISPKMCCDNLIIKKICINKNNILATGGSDNNVLLWEINKNYKSTSLKKHQSEISALSFSDNGEFLISGSIDGHLVIWDMAAMKLIYHINNDLTMNKNEINNIKWYPNNDFFASCFANGIEVWNIKNKENPVLEYFRDSDDDFYFFHYNNYLNLMFVGPIKGNLYSINNEAQKIIKEPYLIRNLIDIKSDNKSFKIINNECLLYYKYESSNFQSFDIKNIADIADDGDKILYFDDAIKIFTISTEQTIIFNDLNGDSFIIKCGRFSKNCDCIILLHNDSNEFYEYNIMSKAKKNIFKGHFEKINCIEYSHDDTKIASGGTDNIIIWRTDKAEILYKIEGQEKQINIIDWWLDSSKIIACYQDNHIIEWDILNLGIQIREFNLSDYDPIIKMLYGIKNDIYLFDGDNLIIKTENEEMVFYCKDFDFTHDRAKAFIYYWEEEEKSNIFYVQDFSEQNYDLKLNVIYEKDGKIYTRKNNLFIVDQERIIFYSDFYGNKIIFSDSVTSIESHYKLLYDETYKPTTDVNKIIIYNDECFYDNNAYPVKDYPFGFSILQIIAYLNDAKSFINLDKLLKRANLILSSNQFTQINNILYKSAVDIVYETNNKELLSLFLNYFLSNYNFKNGIGLKIDEVEKIFNARFFTKLLAIYGDDTYFLNEFLNFIYAEYHYISKFIYKKGFNESFLTFLNTKDLQNEEMAAKIIEVRQEHDKIKEKKDVVSIKCLYYSGFILNSEESQSFFRLLSCLSTDNKIFGNEILMKILDYKWILYGKSIFFKEFFIFFIFFALYVAESIIFFPLRITYGVESEEMQSITTVSICLLSVLILFYVHHIYSEARQMYVLGLKYYFTSVWNCVDAILIITLLPTLLFDVLYMMNIFDDEDIIKSLLSLVILLFSFRIISFSRGIDGAAFMIRLVLSCLKDIGYFLIFMIFFIVGISFSAFVAQDSYTFEKKRGKIRLIKVDMKTSFETFDAFFRRGLGDLGSFDELTVQYHSVKTFFFLISTLVLTIMLMNLLIAIINNTFNSVTQNEKLTRVNERCKIMYEIDTGSKIDPNTPLKNNKLFFFDVVNQEYIKKSQIEELKETIRQLDQKIQDQISEKEKEKESYENLEKNLQTLFDKIQIAPKI